MQLPEIKDLDLKEKTVLLRLDTDVAINENKVTEDFRLAVVVPTIKLLFEKGCHDIIALGHRGRPEGKKNESLSLAPVAVYLKELLEDKLKKEWLEKFYLQENLRFESGEADNSQEFVETLAKKGHIYVNEAFAASHREHASIVGLPKILPHAAGLHFAKEVENLQRILKSPQRPLIFVISGVKNDKLGYLEKFSGLADKILVGGRLPESIHDNSPLRQNDKFVIGDLVADKEDITLHSIEIFEKEIAQAGTVVLSGPLGKFEDEGHRQGTERIFTGLTQTKAFKVAGGGDTIAALDLLNLKEEFDWISVGGGAMLEFLAEGTLPGVKALLD